MSKSSSGMGRRKGEDGLRSRYGESAVLARPPSGSVHSPGRSKLREAQMWMCGSSAHCVWTCASLQVLHPGPRKAITATLPASSLLSIIHFSCLIKWGLRSTSTGESTGCHPLNRTLFSKARMCLQVVHAKRAVFLTQRGSKHSATWYSQPEGSWERERRLEERRYSLLTVLSIKKIHPLVIV